MTRQPATPSIATPPEPARPEGLDSPPPTNTWLVGLVGAVLLAGIAVAQYFRLRRPRIFDRIGGLYDDPHADTER
ncbi:hypothetical protein LH935_15145 [Gordonia polyisoprenivorans]|uniref:hypothetical protein n=1 Tax=Gordonia polyisoprenivorans TaxID=84595 RepID=UPI001A041C6F|nr:hypothetical protein [Gordonia polyisoprenivorans]UZF54098.1 hypothetical protein LH935_15145 [Gordonia polyisoprenivorans]